MAEPENNCSVPRDVLLQSAVRRDDEVDRSGHGGDDPLEPGSALALHGRIEASDCLDVIRFVDLSGEHIGEKIVTEVPVSLSRPIETSAGSGTITPRSMKVLTFPSIGIPHFKPLRPSL